MELKKKILVLKQTEKGFSVGNKNISAILRIEAESGVTSVFLSVINLLATAVGEYRLFFCDSEKKLFVFPLGKRPASFEEVFIKNPNIDGQVEVGIVFISNDLPSLVAFATECQEPSAMLDFKKAVAEKCLAERKARLAELTEKTVCEKNALLDKRTETIYNDEAVATENYYELDRDINEKIEIISEKENDFLRNKNACSDSVRKEKTQESEKDAHCVKDEKIVDRSESLFGKAPYYLTAKRELEAIFEKFPEEESLTSLFPKSRWAKINYSDTKYYAVGIVYEKETVRYICYGIPSVYSATEPEELKGYCSFVPLSVFDMKGKGYWMMFQDAITGECVKKIKV